VRTKSLCTIGAEYWLSEDICYEAAYYSTPSEAAPYTIWEPLNTCLIVNDYYSEEIVSCSDGYASAYQYYDTQTCTPSYYYYSYEFSIYDYCYGYNYRTISCTGAASPSTTPTKSPSKPSTRPTSKPTTKPSSMPARVTGPTVKPTHSPTATPTMRDNALAVFTVAQTLTNIATSDFNAQALNAFSAAVIAAINSDQVISVDIGSVGSGAPSAEMSAVLVHTPTPTSAPTGSVVVQYAVLFTTPSTEVSVVYDDLQTSLSDAVEQGIFQTDLELAAAEQTPVPVTLAACGAMTPPSIATYTVVSTDDRADDFYNLYDDDDVNDGNSGSNNKKPNATVIICASVGAVVAVAALISVVYFYVAKKKAHSGYNAGPSAPVASFDIMNPPVDPAGKIGASANAMEMESIYRGAARSGGGYGLQSVHETYSPMTGSSAAIGSSGYGYANTGVNAGGVFARLPSGADVVVAVPVGVNNFSSLSAVDENVSGNADTSTILGSSRSLRISG
jgi:hypothetical protein